MSSDADLGNAGFHHSAPEGFMDHLTEFMKAAAEMSVEFGKGCRDIVRQSLMKEDSYIGKKLGKGSNFVRRRIGGPCKRGFEKLRVFNDYLPEDKDPLHALAVVFFISAIAFAGIFRFLYILVPEKRNCRKLSQGDIWLLVWCSELCLVAEKIISKRDGE